MEYKIGDLATYAVKTNGACKNHRIESGVIVNITKDWVRVRKSDPFGKLFTKLVSKRHIVSTKEVA